MPSFRSALLVLLFAAVLAPPFDDAALAQPAGASALPGVPAAFVSASGSASGSALVPAAATPGTVPSVTTSPATVVPDGAALPPVAPADAPSGAGGLPRDEVIRDAHDAFLHHDRARLELLRAQALAARHPLAEWVDYWELTNRLNEAGAGEIEAFYARWPDTYLEDRLRNDWLLEVGHRRDWTTFSRDFPRFRMNDDREVACYATLIDHAAGKAVRDAARIEWLAQRDADEGCQLLAQTLYDDKVFDDDDVWRRLRQAAEYGRQRAARAAAQILGKKPLKDIDEVWDNPARYLARRADAGSARGAHMAAFALARVAAGDPGLAATEMTERWQAALGPDDAAWAWAVIAKQGAQSLLPDAVDWSARAWALTPSRRADAADSPGWGDDALGWQARAALRAGQGNARWRDLARAIDAMSPAERQTDEWAYWRARAELALAREGPAGDGARAAARAALAALSTKVSFYGMLSAEDLGAPFALPPRPQPLSVPERAAARANPGLQRGLALVALDLRDEGRREWNYTLRGMTDRELLAAAQVACEAGDWQLCINTSERTRSEFDVEQRYPQPYQRDITGAAQSVGLEPAFVFGLIRQETRFMGQMRSHAGAAGMMQLMPATARWAAKKGGIDYRPDRIADNATNLRVGSFYLKMVLDSFGGSGPMAAAAYNAGPARPRRWRGTLMEDPAVWTENVPFHETRDYVKKVMTNAAVYAALQSGRPPQLRARLGPQIGPRDAEQPPLPGMP